MIQAQEFVEAAGNLGFRWYAGVPCSFLTPFINCVIDDESLRYVSSANEGDALATACGAAIGGRPAVAMMQNSGLGNAVSPITSLSYVFRIPALILCTHRGAPGTPDEPQHELMGRITGELFDAMRVPWEPFPSQTADIAPALARAAGYMEREQRPYGFIMRKGTVAAHALKRNGAGPPRPRGRLSRMEDAGAARMSRHRALQRILERTPESDAIVIATTGYTGRELYALADRPNHLYMVGSMGCASSLGLGLALARPDKKVIVIDGDGAALMRMGNFATVGACGPDNLLHIVLDNEAHDSTGGQATVSGSVRFAEVAHACGYGLSVAGTDLSVIDAAFDAGDVSGPRFVHLKIATGTIADLPRPDLTPPQVVRRLMAHIGASFRDGGPS